MGILEVYSCTKLQNLWPKKYTKQLEWTNISKSRIHILVVGNILWGFQSRLKSVIEVLKCLIKGRFTPKKFKIWPVKRLNLVAKFFIGTRSNIQIVPISLKFSLKLFWKFHAKVLKNTKVIPKLAKVVDTWWNIQYW